MPSRNVFTDLKGAIAHEGHASRLGCTVNRVVYTTAGRRVTHSEYYTY